MIRSFIFSDGKLVGSDLEREALRLVRADKGLPFDQIPTRAS